MFVDLDWPLNASRRLSSSAELLVTLPARKRGICYGNVAGWLGGWVVGWLSVTAGIVSKRRNLSENFLDHLV